MRRLATLSCLTAFACALAGGAAPAQGAILGHAAIDLTRIDFGNQPAGYERATRTVSVTNDRGALPVLITGWSISGDGLDNARPSDFSVTGGTCHAPQVLRGGARCTLDVTFAPRSMGIAAANLNVHVASLSGLLANGDTEDFLTTLVKGRGSRLPGDCSDESFPAMRDRSNPLALSGGPSTASNPLSGANFFVDPTEGLALPAIQSFLRAGNTGAASLLQKIANQPEAKRFGWFTHEGAYRGVRQLMCRIQYQSRGSVPLITVYRLRHEKCGNTSDSPSEQRAYRAWIDEFARGVGRFPAVIFYEMDGLITTGCLSHQGLATRLALLRYGVSRLSRLPHAVVYIDAGAADALPASRAAHLLRAIGIGPIAGFFLNSTHYDWTAHEVAYGARISRALNGKHFVVSTAVNGNGPLVPKSRVRSGNEVLCNPPGRALGTPPTTQTGNRLVDGYLWIGNPGRSGGYCNGSNVRNGYFDPNYALSLARNAHW
jgi:endoglucanase